MQRYGLLHVFPYSLKLLWKALWKAFMLSALWARTMFTVLAWSSFFVDTGLPQALFPFLFVIFMDTVGCSRGLEVLQLCDIRMPSLIFWNHALLASLECGFDWKTLRTLFLFSHFFLFESQLVADKLQKKKKWNCGHITAALERLLELAWLNIGCKAIWLA